MSGGDERNDGSDNNGRAYEVVAEMAHELSLFGDDMMDHNSSAFGCARSGRLPGP